VRFSGLAAAACLPLAAAAAPLRGQAAPPADTAAALALRPAPAGPVLGLVTVGSRAEERLRDAQLRGAAPDEGWLVRSPSSATPWAGRDGAALVAPEAAFTWNSRIPFSLNDGAMWAGRGGSALVMAGAALQAGPVRLIVAPEVAWSENRGFDALLPKTWTAAQRATFRAPWLTGRDAADLPFRFGPGSTTRVLPGESSLTVRGGPVAVGAATEEQWWGPGVRNALLFTNQAAGVPHLFARTARPLRTPLGALEAKWVAGALRSSDYAPGGAPEWRSLSAAALVLHPAGGLAVGAARSVYAPASGLGGTLSAAADVLTRWRGAGDSLAAKPFEQMTSLFARWVFPSEGAEIYGEWGRYRLPSPRELLTTPEHTQGWVMGARWLRPAGAGAVRLEGELTYLERDPTVNFSRVGSWYASGAVPEGYTNQGQPVGAGIGPGGSEQFAAADWLRGGGRIGVFVGRVRWANDAYYDDTTGPRVKIGGRTMPQGQFRGHDVTMMGGLRGAAAVGPMSLDAAWTIGRRYNFLFQNYSHDWPDRYNAVNVTNQTLELRLSPRLR
jgi:hypothetical protein